MEQHRAVVLDGSQAGDPGAAQVRRVLEEELRDQEWRVDVYAPRELEIAPCVGCFNCWVKTPGRCENEDDSQAIAAAMIGSELTVFLTPVTFGGYSSLLKGALDRVICLVSPFFTRIQGEVHHRRRYPKAPYLLGVGVADEVDSSAAGIFSTLLERNAINLHAPGHAAAVVRRATATDAMRVALRHLLMASGLPS